MLSREEMNGLVEILKKNDLEANQALEGERLNREVKQEQQTIAQFTWGGRESSMVNREDLPAVNQMIARLKQKYGDQFTSQGGTEKILKNLQAYLKALIKKAEKEKDQDKVWQYQVALRLFTQPSASRQDYFYDQPDNVHGHSLRELLAYLWIAANDTEAVLRPALERELNKIDSQLSKEERSRKIKEERLKIIEESKLNNFVFTLFDIRREHSGDSPQWEKDKKNDRPSCSGGAFGRLVFKVCPHVAATVLTRENKTLDEIEAASKKVAALDEPVKYETIPHEIENFIMKQLGDPNTDPEIKKAAYNYFTILMTGIDEFESDASEEEKEQFKKDKVTFDGFLETLKSKSKDLIKFLDGEMRGFSLASKPVISESITQIYQLILTDLSSESTAKKDPTQIYRSEADRNFIERIRKEGAKVLQGEELAKKIETDQEIISYRRQIKELSFMFESMHELVQNEIRRGLLALGTLKLPEQQKQWQEIENKMKAKLAYFNEVIEKEWQPRLVNLRAQLDTAVTTKFGKEKINVERKVGFGFVADAALGKIKVQAAKTADRCEELSSAIQASTTSFYQIAENPSDTQLTDKLKSHWRQFHSKKETGDIVTLWVSEIMRVVQSETLENKSRELERLRDLMEECFENQGALKWQMQEQVSMQIVRLNKETKDAAIPIVSSTFPMINQHLIANPKVFAAEVVSMVFSKENKEELAAIEERFKQYSPTFQALIVNAIQAEFYAKLKNNPNIPWQERKKAILALTKLFPDKIKELGLEFLAMTDVAELTKNGEVLLGEDKADAFEIAGRSLILITYPEHGSPQSVAPETVKENFQAWIDMGRTLLSIPVLKKDQTQTQNQNQDQDQTTNKILTTSEEDGQRFQKLAQFVFLTVCRNLELTDIRLGDKDALEKICRMYLMTPNQKSDIGGPMYDLVETDTLSKRLDYLGSHLACMLTTLKPLSTLFNTGHVRILDRAGAEDLLSPHDIHEENKFIVRTSTSTPNRIAYTFHQKETEQINSEILSGANLTVPLLIPKPGKEKSEITFNLVRDDSSLIHSQGSFLKKVCTQIDPRFTLIPYDHVRQAAEEMRDDYKVYAVAQEDHYHLVDNKKSQKRKVQKGLEDNFYFASARETRKNEDAPVAVKVESPAPPATKKVKSPPFTKVSDAQTTRVMPEVSKKPSGIKISAQRTGVTLFQPNDEPKKTKRRGPLKRIREFIRNIRYRR